jgi:SHS2 domain-containing protein
MGFEELPHTADCALRVWAPDLAGLFGEAALGLNSLAGAAIGGGPRVTREILLRSGDTESLLVAFLAELICIQEQEHLGFDRFKLLISNDGVSGEMEGSRLSSLMRPVKAVTFHNLKIRTTARGRETEIVFDV